MEDFKAQDEGLPSSVLDSILDSQKPSDASSKPLTEPLATQAEEIASSTPEEVISEVSDDEEKKLSELPEFAKKKIGQNEKKYGRQIERLNSEMEAIRQQNLQMQQILLQTLQPQAAQSDYVKDPITGEMYAPDSKEAEFARYYQKVEQAKERNYQQQVSMSQKEKISQKLDAELVKLSERHDDFSDVMGNVLNKIGFREGYSAVDHPITALAALSSEGAEVLYRLGKNPDELSQLSRMSPEDQASRFLDLVTNYKLNSKSSNAPPPNKRTPNPPEATNGKPVDPFDSYESTLALMRQETARGR